MDGSLAHWKDCYKPFEATFDATADGKAVVSMHMAIDQHLADEGWGWHSMEFELQSCADAHSKTSGATEISAVTISDDCTEWDKTMKHTVDGICYLGPFAQDEKTVKKTFTGLSPGCSYKWTAIIDTYASVDSEQMSFTVNDHSHEFSSRSATTCSNGWSEYPAGFRTRLGMDEANANWKDCYKPFEATFDATADGKAVISMHMAIDQHLADEGWGWHSMKFELQSCVDAQRFKVNTDTSYECQHGGINVADEHACAKAAEELGLTYGGSHALDYCVKGCFEYDGEYSEYHGVYWNSHPNGLSPGSEDHHAICDTEATPIDPEPQPGPDGSQCGDW
jgi:hypothetical protein